MVLDFRTASPDPLPDPVGWALLAIAAGRLGLVAARNLAAVAGVASVAGVWLHYGHRMVDLLTGELVPGEVDPGSGAPVHLLYDDATGWRLAGMTLAAAAAATAGVTGVRPGRGGPRHVVPGAHRVRVTDRAAPED